MHQLLRCLCLLCLPAVKLPGAEAWLFQEQHMGCLYSIKIVAETRELAAPHAAAAYRRIAALDAKFSDYKPDSEINQLGPNLGPGAPQAASADVFACLEASQRFWKWSDGVFDVTLGTCTKLWRQSRKSGVLPEPDVLAASREHTGFRHLRLQKDTKSVLSNVAGIQFDFGGIAKGFALDEASKLLLAAGQKDFLLDAGGQIVGMGHAPGTTGWKVAIERLPQETNASTVVVVLQNQHLATSGDLHQFVEIGGKRYSHILDPATGLGVTTSRQVSVLAPEGATADAVATVLCVVSAEKSLALLKQLPGVEARIVELAADGETSITTTPGWPSK
jgi:thiamine biosynthesis lipoprotein